MFDAEGQSFKECVALEPPHPILSYMYRCDNVFYVDDVLALYENPCYYGLIWINGNECKWYRFYLRGNHPHADLISKKSVHLAKHHKKGGQSQARIGHLHDESHQNYITLMSEQTERYFWQDDRATIEGLMIAGNGKKKEQLEKKLPAPLQDIVIGSLTRESFSGLLEACVPLIQKYTQDREERWVNAFLSAFDQESTSIVYGPKYVRKALMYGQIKTLFLHQETIAALDIHKERMQRIQDKCVATGCTLRILTTHSSSTQRFIDLGGIGGILWYPSE
jgi:peptide chain release factor subunit 1